MTRHIADRQSPSDGTRALRFVSLVKAQGEEGSHPASRTLARRPKDRDDARRLQQFLRIDRGIEA